MQVLSFRQLSEYFGGKSNRSVIILCVLVVFQDFCLYLSYNNVSGVTTDSHRRITARLPDRVYLDRTASFSFSLFIRAHQLTLESIG